MPFKVYTVADAYRGVHKGHLVWMVNLDNGYYRWGATIEDLQRSLDARNAETAANVAKIEADVELRQEVVDEMVSNGIARHVALNRTNTEAKMLAEAKAFGII